MSKALGKLKRKKDALQQVVHGPYLKTTIRAGLATPAPPLGPQLGQRGINVAQFCKDFNSKTSHMLEGTPIPTRIWVNPDRSFRIDLMTPQTSWLILRAAGIRRGAMHPGKQVAGKITRKHVFEIAKLKFQDDIMKVYSMEQICRLICISCLQIGVQVVDSLDPEEYREFLEKRKEEMIKEMMELENKKAAKMLRTGATP